MIPKVFRLYLKQIAFTIRTYVYCNPDSWLIILSKALNLHGLCDLPVKTGAGVMNRNSHLYMGAFLVPQFTLVPEHLSVIINPVSDFSDEPLV